MKLLSRLLAPVTVALALLALPSSALAWGETERLTGPEVAKLADPPPAAALPPRPVAMTADQHSALLGRQLPVRIDTDASGNMYVVSQGPAVEVGGQPWLEGALAADPGDSCPQAFGDELPSTAYLYTASLVSVYRVDVTTGAVRLLRSFIAQSEVDAPGEGLNEPAHPPAGLAVDATAAEPKLYVSVAGQGIWRMSLSSESWSRFVTDDHETWLPYEDATERLDDGEGAASLVRCLRGDSGASFYYGSLWEGGPTVPAAIAVDPLSHAVYIAEQTAATANTTDRQYPGRLRIRRFSAAGASEGEVDLTATGFSQPADGDYPAPDGTISGQLSVARPGAPGWLLGTASLDSSDADTRVGGLAFAGDSTPSLAVLNQLETRKRVASDGVTEITTGQIVRIPTTGDAAGKADAVYLSDGETGQRPFGPVNSRTTVRGIGDITTRTTPRGPRYLVPTTSSTQPGLLEMAEDGAALGFIGSASGSACAWNNERIRLTTDPRDGTILILQQQDPAVDGSQPMILRLDPRSTGCVETTPPEEVEPTDPVVTVVGSQYEDSPDGPVPPGGGPFAFSPVASGDTVTLDEEDTAAGWVFSVRVEDEDNQGGDFGPAARCDREITVQGGSPTSTTSPLAGGACRPAVDDALILGSSGTASYATFVVTKEKLLPEGASAPRPVALKVEVTDDEGVEADPITINIVLKTKVRAPIAIGGFQPVKAARDRFRYSMVAEGFDEWQVDFGDPAGTRQPPTGFLPASSFTGSSAEITYPAPGEYTATLTVRRDGGTKPEDIATKTAKVLVEAEQQQRPVTVVTPQSGAPCDTPLGIPLAQVGLGDQLLCVPADPCDVNTAELGLTKLPIVRPASCAGDDSSLFAAAEGSGPPPLGSRPIFLARTLRLSADRKIAARIRCSTGPSSCAGRVRMQLIRPGKAAATIGTTSFKELVAEKTATVSVKVSAANARLLRRTTRPRVRVTVIPSVGATFTRPASHTRTVNLSAPKPRRTR